MPERKPADRAEITLSERLAQALRHNDIDALRDISPHAAALLPLLRELGWQRSARELIEALPHFVDSFDLDDLRNVLVTLGYESMEHRIDLQGLDPDLYPALYVGQGGELLLLRQHGEQGIEAYDCNARADIHVKDQNIPGYALLFTDLRPTHGFADAVKQDEPWFHGLARRFLPHIGNMLLMTLLINLIALAVPIFIMVVYDKVIGAKSVDALPYLLAGIGGALLADMVLRYLRAQLIGAVAGRLDYLIGVETFKQILHLPPLFTERSTMAAQLSRLKQFDAIRDFFTGPNASLLLELPFVALSILVMALIAGAVAWIPLLMLAIYILFGLHWLPAGANTLLKAGRARTDKQRMLIQTLGGRHEIKGNGAETTWQERFREFSGESITANYQTTLSNAVLHTFAQASMTLTGIAVLALGTHQVLAGEMSIGALIATMALIWRVLGPMQSAFLSFSKLVQMTKTIRQLNQLMKLEIERHSSSSLILSDLSGRLTVDRVSFRYGPELDPALLGVSFSLKPGEMLAVVGNTGAGKSTLLKLIAGMYRPQAGSLVLDEFDLRQLNAMDLRRAIGYVPQQARFFHGTIAQNLRLNNMLATDEELRRVCETAGILEIIQAMPQGFATRIGDQTIDRQPPGFVRSLSIARALLKDSRVLLMDEPGASLDHENDERLMQLLKRLKGQKTVIIVSHRPSHIRLADKAIMLDQGTVTFVGKAEQAVTLLLENAA